jgi:hypothetical protein
MSLSDQSFADVLPKKLKPSSTYVLVNYFYGDYCGLGSPYYLQGFLDSACINDYDGNGEPISRQIKCDNKGKCTWKYFGRHDCLGLPPRVKSAADWVSEEKVGECGRWSDDWDYADWTQLYSAESPDSVGWEDVKLYSIQTVKTDANGQLPYSFTRKFAGGFGTDDQEYLSVDTVKLYPAESKDWYMQRRSLRVGSCRPQNEGSYVNGSPLREIVVDTNSTLEISCDQYDFFNSDKELDAAVKVPLTLGEAFFKIRIYIAQTFNSPVAECYPMDLQEEIVVRYSMIPTLGNIDTSPCINGFRLYKGTNGIISLMAFDDSKCTQLTVEDKQLWLKGLKSFPPKDYGRCITTRLGFSMQVELAQKEPECTQVIVRQFDETSAF